MSVESEAPVKRALPFIVILAMAVAAKHIRDQIKFRGYPPRTLGRRAQARSEGCTNHREKLALLAEAERDRKLREQQELEAAATRRMAEHGIQPQPQPLP